jgi:hypothetical protein
LRGFLIQQIPAAMNHRLPVEAIGVVEAILGVAVGGPGTAATANVSKPAYLTKARQPLLVELTVEGKRIGIGPDLLEGTVPQVTLEENVLTVLTRG